MSPSQQLQRLLADVPQYDPADIVQLLPLAAALQSAIYARILALQHQAAFPATDYLLNIDDVAARLGKSHRWIRDNLDSLDFGFRMGKDYRFSARGLDEWISENMEAKMAAALPPEGRQHAR